MTLPAALHATVGTLRRRPAELLAFYAIGAAVPSIARVPISLGGLAIIGYLQVTSQLGSLVAELASRDLQPPDPEVEPEVFAAWFQDLQPALEVLADPVIVALVVTSVAVAIITAIIVTAAVSAGQIAACHGCLKDQRGTTAGIEGVRRHGRTFVGAYLLELGIWGAVSLATVVVVSVGIAISPLLGIAVGVLAAMVWLPLMLATRAVFAFVTVAAVVDDTGLLESIRSSAVFIRRQPLEAIGYYTIAVGGLLTVSTVAAVLSIVQAGNAIAPLAVLLVAPALSLLKTGLFAQYRGGFSPPDGAVPPLRTQVSAGLRYGTTRLLAFVSRTPVMHLIAIGLLGAGLLSGWVGAAPFTGAIETSIVDRLSDHFPPAAALNFFGNNLTVSVSMAYSGVALAVPAALTLWFNGLLLGVVAQLEASPAVLAAFVMPHGLFELPALIVSGALGLRLGVVGWLTWRGRTNQLDFADALEDAFWVLVGVAVLLVIAAAIEGFVSPYYWRLFL